MENTTELDSIIINNLSKRYKANSTLAVNNLSLHCNLGEIVGLLGHNGAGKSTTLKCLTGILPFNEGEIIINGFNIHKDAVKAKQTFGFVSDRHDVFVKMTGNQYLAFMANSYGVSKENRIERIKELDEIFELGDRLNDTISDYSFGMRQKICMMGSIIHKPKLWILDEPLGGLDPSTADKVADYMLSYAKEGNCILFSSHNINSVQKICSKIIIMHQGIKTDDFLLQDFIKNNPNINLEEYFLSHTKKEVAND